ncbi:MAG: type II toxin-antitoxin system Phd/YefM family antitoxin [Leptolyngbyaceae cyanobacterium RM2_2_4]|nr:type II toxin-antitoxin system Phd/YefM family antitoxin [Leptolyngbyaceae cyanobacterium SM1_4_3]NJN91089.1 type II toxin-antitoxin system Phd/YefM family antitoxin [Leptolyngbyaceae cyanobacterium SL_5_14]NJO50175.1 type II toxin-antitoxin system Phd/YefM family antitoxin [Leptolyngbyaceae cyanobacterium RM2_2_4]
MILVNEAQQSLQDLIDSVSQSHQPIVIAGQNSNAVLLSEADWAAVQETLYLLSIPGMRESIREGLATPIEECDRQLEW